MRALCEGRSVVDDVSEVMTMLLFDVDCRGAGQTAGQLGGDGKARRKWSDRPPLNLVYKFLRTGIVTCKLCFACFFVPECT